MPLVAHNSLPTFERLRRDGVTVLSTERAANQEIRELHVGLLNMMPDAALEATERQFYRLVGESNPIAQFYMHPFTLPTLPRGEKAQAHIAEYYESFEAIRAAGLDALIITGANVSHPNLADEPFWNPLIEVIDWAWDHVTSTLCSCLATHAVMQFRYGQTRVKQPKKIWGVFEHRVTDGRHPLVADVNTRFDVPHSRWNDVSRAQFEAAGVKVLVESAEAGVHLAVSGDGLRTVFFQGHPEYDTVSLLKEYKRDLLLAASGKLPAWPPFPVRYFNRQAQALFAEYGSRLRGGEALEFPEAHVLPLLDNTWHDTAEAVIGNWIGCVYQVTHRERGLPFMPGVDPDNPLGL
ncbi:MAG: homoserine O-succinyltransferase [Pseudomonadota bacterium]